MESLSLWTPIGTKEHPFEAEFDVANHTISGLVVQEYDTNYAGFFGYVSNGVIKNTVFIDEIIRGPRIVGGIAGAVIPTGGNTALIENCIIETGEIWSQRWLHFEDEWTLSKCDSAGGNRWIRIF